MKVLLEIQDDKAPALLEVLNSLPYVTTKELSDSKKSIFIKEFKEAVEEVKLAKQGKIKLQTLDELIDEL